MSTSTPPQSGCRAGRRGSQQAEAWSAPKALRKAIGLLDRRERWRFALLVALTPLAAIGEMAAVAALLPFLAAVSDPALLEAIPMGRLLVAWLRPEGQRELVLMMGLGVCLVLVSTNALIVGSAWFTLRFSWLVNHRLSTTLLRQYLHQPYAYFLSENSAGLASNLLVQVRQVTQGFLVPALSAFGRGAAAVALLAFLALTEPLLALAAAGLIGGIYSGFYFILARRLLRDLGTRRFRNDRHMGQVVSEAFGGIKEVKLLHAEEAFVGAYRPLSLASAHDNVTATLIAIVPRYVVEAVAFGSVVLVTLAVFQRSGGQQELVPLLGTFAFAGYRLMPSIQYLFDAFVQIRTSVPAFERLHADLHLSARAEGAPVPASDGAGSSRQLAPLAPRQAIELRGLCFRYPGASAPALVDFHLSIGARTTTGIVGPTGAGKTTVIDLLLGLLRPSAGQIVVDGSPLSDAEIERWQRAIGYVPQHIYLSDASIAENVAFGVPVESIDRARVEEACRSAQIHDFIQERLPDSYDTKVGERGVRLSGGERQRIGIARALYRRPEVLILDEATSALDSATEAAVMRAIDQLTGQKTIVMIAHREATLRGCDVIYRITRGRLELVGSPAVLLAESRHLQPAIGESA